MFLSAEMHLFTKVGTRYFFLSPLPLVRYLEIVLPLRAGPLFSQICQSASAGPLFRYRYFFRSALAELPLVPLSGIYQMIPLPTKQSRWTVPLNTQAGIKEIS